MKKNILALTISFFSLTNLIAQWEILNEGLSFDYLTASDFINEDVGWVAGLQGSLYKTIDGGENWSSIPYNESWNFRMIDFINESIGWASGTIGWEIAAAWKTTDGGFSWFQQLYNMEFNSLHAIDENNIYAIGGNNIYKTTNGGTTWNVVLKNLPDRIFNSLWFQNLQTGVVVGSYRDGIAEKGIILKTSNGGTTWQQTIVNEFNNIYELQFLNNTNGYFRANLDTTNFICKTEDMLSSWTIITRHPYSITSYQYLDNNNVYAIMGDSITANNLMRSSDGGVNWQIVQSLTLFSYTLSVNKIFLGNSGNGIMIGSFEGGWVLFKKLDDEDNWKIQRFSYPIKDVFFIDKNKGFIAGYSVVGLPCGVHCSFEGNIFYTIDGGKNWDIKFYTIGRMKSCVFVNELIGFSLTVMTIYKTTDAGNNWTIVYPDSARFRFNDICFLDSKIGFAVGARTLGDYHAEILSTTDGGENWKLVWSDSLTAGYDGIISLYFADSTGWAIGDNGTIVKYTPQNGWIKQTSVTDLPLSKVFFSDENHGWIAGGYLNSYGIAFQSILLITTNGGGSWKANKNLPYLINDIWFVTNQHGWAVGCDTINKGVILETKDGGTNWTVTVDKLIGPLKSIFIKDNYAWAVGDNGLILRTTNASVTWVENENLSFPTEFVLEQNYPNPFNPTTSIEYRVGSTEYVTLKVYDVLGREVAALVNEVKQPGVYEVEFNGANLSSGIYLCHLQSGDFSAVKKMILLK